MDITEEMKKKNQKKDKTRRKASKRLGIGR